MSKRKTHDEFIRDFNIKGNKNVIIIGEYINDKTPILVKCKIDGYEWYASPNNLLRGHGCLVCAGKVVVHGINDFATLRPDLIKYFVDANDAKNITVYTHKIVKLICPDCGAKRTMPVYQLSQQGFSCSICGDNISFPNKFGRMLLKQLPVEDVQHEYHPDWLKPYFYDNYFKYNGNEYILEMDGNLGHGNRQFKSKDKDIIGLEKDKLKDILAAERNIQVIRIDCKKSESGYIVHNILSSKLSDLFDLTNIDWNLCEQYALSNIVKLVCNAYSSNKDIRIIDIANMYMISRKTVYEYLKQGTKLGLCNYTSQKSIQLHHQRISKSVGVCDIYKNYIGVYSSIKQCAIQMTTVYDIKIDRAGIRRAIESGNPYKNFYFRYT